MGAGGWWGVLRLLRAPVGVFGGAEGGLGGASTMFWGYFWGLGGVLGLLGVTYGCWGGHLWGLGAAGGRLWGLGGTHGCWGLQGAPMGVGKGCRGCWG